MNITKNTVLSLILFTIIISIGCQEETNKQEDPILNKSTGFEALDALSAKIDALPDNDSLRAVRAAIYHSKEIYSEAIRDYSYALSIDSTNADYHSRLAEVFLDNNQSYEAIEILELAKQRFPKNKEILLQKAKYHLIVKQYLEALTMANKVIENNPQDGDAYFLKGVTYKDMKAPAKAMEAFQTAVELNPDLYEAYIIMGNMMSKENKDMALQFFENASLIQPKDPEVAHYKAVHLGFMGRYEEALKAFEKIHQMDPNYKEAFLNAGLIAYEMDSLDYAKKLFTKATDIDQNYKEALYFKAVIDEEAGLIPDAILWYEKVLAIDSNHTEAKAALERLKK